MTTGTRILLAVGLIVVAVVVSAVLRRRTADAPTQPRRMLPTQLDRSDFAASTDWIVVVFTSATCHTCADVLTKAAVLASDAVTVIDVEYSANKALQERYAIDAVPSLVIADAEGVVRAGFVGPVSATDLWAAMAEAREPGSRPPSDCHDHNA